MLSFNFGAISIARMCMSKEGELKAFALMSLIEWNTLPDCVLGKILWMLPGAHVPVTRVVSRRWRCLLANYHLQFQSPVSCSVRCVGQMPVGSNGVVGMM